MDTLPTELCRSILSHLSVPEVKSIRLSSRRWADLGTLYLLSPIYNLHRNRPSFMHLQSLSEHPRLSPCIQHLVFHMGEINEWHARHNSYFVQYMRDSTEREEDSIALWASYRQWKDNVEMFAAEYCAPGLLKETLPRLEALREIEVRLNECPFDDALWLRIWGIASTRDVPRESAIERFTNILAAAALTEGRLERLSHDRLPMEFWHRENAVTNCFSGAFTGLRHLKLTSDCVRLPNDAYQQECLRYFGRCLEIVTGLESLHLAFEAERKPLIVFTDCFKADFSWPHLHTFVLEGVVIREDDLAEFLLRHSASLKRLNIGGTGFNGVQKSQGLEFASGTLEGLLTQLQGLRSLEKLNMRPCLGPLPARVIGGDNFPLYDDEWNRLVGLENHILGFRMGEETLATVLERFTIDRSSWPGERLAGELGI